MVTLGGTVLEANQRVKAGAIRNIDKPINKLLKLDPT